MASRKLISYIESLYPSNKYEILFAVSSVLSFFIREEKQMRKWIMVCLTAMLFLSVSNYGQACGDGEKSQSQYDLSKYKDGEVVYIDKEGNKFIKISEYYSDGIFTDQVEKIVKAPPVIYSDGVFSWRVN
jgi:hypothetical protein